MKRLNFVKPCMIAVLGAAAMAPSMFGNTVTPGSTVSPDVFTNAAGITVLATTGPVNINPVPGTSFNATYIEAVAQDTNNIYCPSCLDFLIYATNAGPGLFERVTTSSFSSFLTDVGYNAGSPVGAGGVVPTTIDRSANGGIIGFNFIPPGTPVSAGQNTVLLEVQTNAKYFTSGFVSIQDGTSGFGAGFAPTATPEPMSMALLGSGLLLIGTVRKRFGSKKETKA